MLSEDFYRLPLLCHLSQGCSNKVMWGVIGAAVVITLITIPAVIYNSKLEPWPVSRFSFLSFQKAATDATSKQTSFCVCAFPICLLYSSNEVVNAQKKWSSHILECWYRYMQVK